MPLFGMARESKMPEGTPSLEKPLPEPRPGTSGTEDLLVTNRRRASQVYQQSLQAEKAYKAKKRASYARRDFQSARGHYREGFHHLKEAIKMTFNFARFSPYIFSEKKHQYRQHSVKRRNTRRLEKRRRGDSQITTDAPDDTNTYDEPSVVESREPVASTA